MDNSPPVSTSEKPGPSLKCDKQSAVRLLVLLSIVPWIILLLPAHIQNKTIAILTGSKQLPVNYQGFDLNYSDVNIDVGNRSYARVHLPPICESKCFTPYESHKMGYPPVAMHGAYSGYICDTTFRDLADYVMPGWPFQHENYVKFEGHITVQPIEVAAKCLPPVPIIYAKHETVQLFLSKLAPHLHHGYILISGSSDYGNPGTNKNVLSDKKLVKWFGINPDMEHKKFEPIPEGITCQLHAVELNKFRENQNKKVTSPASIGKEDKLLLLSFRLTHPSRKKFYKFFCRKSWVICIKPEQVWKGEISKTVDNLKKINNIDLLKNFSNYPFWLAPRGNGLDTTRIFEALYVGSIPIIEKSLLDPVYSDMKILTVKDFTKEVTEKFLRQKLIEFRKRTDFNLRKQTREYWWKKIESVRADELDRLSLVDQYRKRCWF